MANDLGVGYSALGKWISAYRHDDLQKELAQLRKENKILREERNILKKATVNSTVCRFIRVLLFCVSGQLQRMHTARPQLRVKWGIRLY